MADLKLYLPEGLRGVRELSAIMDAETPEFSSLSVAQRRMLDDQFVMTASESAIRRYEQMLGIPRTTKDSLDDRRLKILVKLNNQLPYSMGWLRNKLDTLFGAGNYEIIRDVHTRKLAIQTDAQFEPLITALHLDLRQSIPANMVLETYITSNHTHTMCCGCWMQTMDDLIFEQDRPDGDYEIRASGGSWMTQYDHILM